MSSTREGQMASPHAAGRPRHISATCNTAPSLPNRYSLTLSPPVQSSHCLTARKITILGCPAGVGLAGVATEVLTAIFFIFMGQPIAGGVGGRTERDGHLNRPHGRWPTTGESMTIMPGPSNSSPPPTNDQPPVDGRAGSDSSDNLSVCARRPRRPGGRRSTPPQSPRFRMMPVKARSIRPGICGWSTWCPTANFLRPLFPSWPRAKGLLALAARRTAGALGGVAVGRNRPGRGV